MSEFYIKQTEPKMADMTEEGYLSNVKEIDIEGIMSASASGVSLKLTGVEEGTLLALLGWSQDMTFSATDTDTVAWTSGTITLADGRSFSISAGNTGNMSALTYIFLDISVSETVLQTTTTASLAVGGNRLLIAVAENKTTEAVFQVFGGKGGILITADNIAANSITANEISANGITGALIQTAATGYRTRMTSANGVEFMNGDTQKGIIYADTGDTLIIKSAANIQGFAGSSSLGVWNADGLTLPSGKKLAFSGGTTITDAGSECRIDRQTRVSGTLYPSSNEDYDCGASDKAWDGCWAQDFNDTSARWKKKNIKNIKYGLNDILKMIPRSFNWKKTNKESIGFIADEMIDIVPEIVKVDKKKGPMTISYDKIVAVLVKAVQEQQTQIEELKIMIDSKETT